MLATKAVFFQPGMAATGGDTIVTSGGYKYHVFTTTGSQNFVATSAGEIDFIIVGGGASGGRMDAGGGGAGGLVQGTSHNISAGTYAMVVGAGGAATTYLANAAGNNGSNSTGFGFTASGGGYGGQYAMSPYTGVAGGSGGGGAGGSGSSTGPYAGGATNQNTFFIKNLYVQKSLFFIFLN